MPPFGPMPAGVPGGGLPPGMGAPPANVGPATIPQNNPGNIAKAVQGLQMALQIIEQQIPLIPFGAPLHQATMKVATELSKHLADHKENAALTQQTLLQAMRGFQNDNQMAALGRLMPQPNQPPAMPAAAA